MGFELAVVDHFPPTNETDLLSVVKRFLIDIGYLTKGYGPRTGAHRIAQSVPYRLFAHCFLVKRDTIWDIPALLEELDTTLPTLYRHLNKLKHLDLLEEVELSTGRQKKAYMLRYKNFGDAWSFPETHVSNILRAYRRLTMRIQHTFSAPGRRGASPRSIETAEAKPAALEEGAGANEADAAERATAEAKKQQQEVTAGSLSRQTRAFAITLSSQPIVEISYDDFDVEAGLLSLLLAIGYINPRGQTLSEKETLRESYPYRLFVDGFLAHPDRFWTVDEFAAELDISVHTVYQHLNKLRSMDIVEERVSDIEHPSTSKRSYRLRYGELGRAWVFVESHIKSTIKKYRKTVDHIQKLLEAE